MATSRRRKAQPAGSADEIPVLWKKLEVLSKVLASVLIPVAIAFVGNATKSSIESRNVGLKYIELAVSILKEKPTPETENLRKWAIGTVNSYSTVPLTDAAQKELEKKQLTPGSTSTDVVASFEGFQPRAYLDSAGIWEIGYGHNLTGDEQRTGIISVTGQPIYFRDGITEEQAQQILDVDLQPFDRTVDELVKVPLTANQHRALVSFTYNVGTGAFEKSSLLVKLNSGKYDEIPDELQKWSKGVGGVVLPGLQRRRQFEADIWKKPDSGK
jgi:GH24 family phage-related lysozyme (muramidase)